MIIKRQGWKYSLEQNAFGLQIEINIMQVSHPADYFLF